MPSANLIETADEHHWVMLQHRITQLMIDASSFRLQCWSLDASFEVRFAVPFTLELPSGAVRALDPEQPEGLAPLLSLLGRYVESVTITRDGDLSVELDSGHVLRVRAHPRHEAWEMQGGGALEGMSYLAMAAVGRPWG